MPLHLTLAKIFRKFFTDTEFEECCRIEISLWTKNTGSNKHLANLLLLYYLGYLQSRSIEFTSQSLSDQKNKPVLDFDLPPWVKKITLAYNIPLCNSS